MAINLGDISRFKYLAHKVMPLVFDETLSYYEFLCKVIAKLNEVIDNENEQNTAIEQMSVNIDEWEEAAIQRYNEFTAAVDLAIEQFEQRVTESQESFEESIRDRADEFEETMTERADQFEDDITDQQDDFETEIRGAWDEFFQTYLQTLGVVQVTGQSTTDVMSQKAVSDKLADIHTVLDPFSENFEIETPIEVTLTPQTYWNSESSTAVLTSYNGYRASTPIPAIPRHKYKAIVYTGSSAKQHTVLCVDSSYNILSSYRQESQANRTYEFITPRNTAYILLTKGTNSNSANYLCELYSISYAAKDDFYDLFVGKNVAIIGDSISTNGTDGDYPNVPEITIGEGDVGEELSAYLTYYDYTGGLSLGGHTFTSEEVGTEVTFIPVEGDIGKKIGVPNNYNESSIKTWWECIMDKYPFNPIPVCWSGSSYSSHEGSEQIYATSYAWHDAQIRKCGIRTVGTMNRTAPDIIILYRGVNDFSHSPYDKLTDNYPEGVNWTYPVNDTVTGGTGFKEAICLTVKKLRETYPNAFIFLCTLGTFKRVNYSSFPVNNGTNTVQEYNQAIRECANWLGIPLIEFDKDGITFENCYTGGFLKESTNSTHPTNLGHKVMGDKALEDLKSKYSPTT